MSTARQIIDIVNNAFSVISNERDLSPNNEAINTTLGPLVQTLSGSYESNTEQEVLKSPFIIAIKRPLWQKLSMAESAMESFWADRFSEKDVVTNETLKEFWYHKNYADLVEGEINAIKQSSISFSKKDSIAFVGSGPLPMTPIFLHYATGRTVTCIDYDPQACEKSKVLISKLGLAEKIQIVSKDAKEHNYRPHPLVIVAALVPKKETLVSRIFSQRPDCLVGLRSSERLHEILYEPVDWDNISNVNEVSRTAYHPDIINTTHFLKCRNPLAYVPLSQLPPGLHF